MNFLNQEQKSWIVRRNIKENGIYPFPLNGFYLSESASYSARREWIHTSIFGKNLANHSFLVKEKKNGFCRGNFYKNPLTHDIYILESELTSRSVLEVLFLLILTFVPMVAYNWFRFGFGKVSAS